MKLSEWLRGPVPKNDPVIRVVNWISLAVFLVLSLPVRATVPSSTTWVQYTTTTLPQTMTVPFVFQNAADLLVLDSKTSPPITLTLNSDYSVSGGNGSTGTVSTKTGGANSVAAGDIVTISRRVPITQTTNFSNGGPLTASMIGQAFDKATTISQQLNLVGANSLQFQPDEQVSGVLPKSARSGNVVGFDQSGRLTFYPPASVTITGSAAAFSSVAALKSASVAGILNGTIVAVSGYYSAGDNGGVTYVWSSTSTATDNAGTVIQPAGVATGRWILQVAGPLNVKWFGAYGDGSHDDTAALTAAWSVIKGPGGAIYLPAGNYYVPSGLDLHATAPDSSVSFNISGDGIKKSSITTHNANVGLDLGGRNRVFLRNFRLQDNGTTANVGIARYRDTTIGSDGGGSYHYYENVAIEGAYAKAALYSIGSEVNYHINLQMDVSGAGAGYFSSALNGLSVTAGGTITGGSNTVNAFFGGHIIAAPSTGGGAVYLDQITDQLAFYGTYLVGWTGGYNVKLGINGTTSASQGAKIFDACRFEGDTDAILCNAYQVQGLIIRGSTFGESAGYDINWTGVTNNTGLDGAIIEGNQQYNRGMVLPVIKKSRIVVGDTNVYYANTITVNVGISESHIEAASLTLGGSAIVYSSDILQINPNLGTFRHLYGPNSPTSAGNSQGSVIVNKPFGTAPTSPVAGTIATSDSAHWNPTGQGSTNLPMFYDGAAWQPMTVFNATPASSAASGTAGTITWDANYVYVCTSTNAWKRSPIAWTDFSFPGALSTNTAGGNGQIDLGPIAVAARANVGFRSDSSGDIDISAGSGGVVTIGYDNHRDVAAYGGWTFNAATGGSQGAGTINVSGGVYKNGVAYTNPDYVLERWATGKINRFADKPGAKDYTGLRSLRDVESAARRDLHLDGFGPAAKNDLFSGSDALLARVEESYLYLFDHDHRISAVEARGSLLELRIFEAVALLALLLSIRANLRKKNP